MSEYKADIINNTQFKWTQKEMSDDERKTVPYIKLFAWENKTNEAVQNYIYNKRKVTLSMAAGIDKEKSFYQIYDQMYLVGKKLAEIKVPYKGIYPYSITSNYSEISSDPTNWGSVLESLKTDVGRTAENVLINYRTLFNEDGKMTELLKFSNGKVYHKQTIKMFNSAEPNQYETTFPLLNESPDLVKKHLEFILTMQTLLVPNLKTINIMELPALWRFEIPGIMVIPFGFIGKFTATPKGPSKLMDVSVSGAGNNGTMTIPNAWEIHIVLNSLTPPSVQMQRLLWGGKKDPGLGGNKRIYNQKGEYDPKKFSQDESTTPPPAATPTPAAGTRPSPASQPNSVMEGTGAYNAHH